MEDCDWGLGSELEIWIGDWIEARDWDWGLALRIWIRDWDWRLGIGV